MKATPKIGESLLVVHRTNGDGKLVGASKAKTTIKMVYDDNRVLDAKGDMWSITRAAEGKCRWVTTR